MNKTCWYVVKPYQGAKAEEPKASGQGYKRTLVIQDPRLAASTFQRGSKYINFFSAHTTFYDTYLG